MNYRWALPIFLGVLILGLDSLTKLFTHLFLPQMSFDSVWYPYGGIGIFRNLFGIEFSINHVINKGAAWGMFSDFQLYLLVLRLICITAIILYLVFFNQNKSLNLPCALITAGALGNVIDTIIYGHVIDMFHFVFWGYSYPVFNIADSAVFIGIIWLFFISAPTKNKKRKSIG